MILSASSTYIDNVVESFAKRINSPIPIVIVTRQDNYKFNEELLKLDKYVLIDFVEYGYDWKMDVTHIFGYNTYYYKEMFDGGEWNKFDEWVGERKPIVYFKRELLSRYAFPNILPIDYPCTQQLEAPQTKEQFEERIFMFNFCWGLSHEGRKRVHADIWRDAGKYGYVVCDNISNIVPFVQNEKNPKKVLTVNTPWYSRYPIETINDINRLSKITFSLAGAGRKCFRHTEIINSLMLMWNDELSWSYSWEDDKNCIKCEEGMEIGRVMAALRNPNLYEIYLANVEQIKNYHIDSYIPNYIEKIINEAI